MPIGNGNVLVNFDRNYNLRDIYYPYVGMENHTLGEICRFGVWTPEGFGWTDDPEVRRQAAYVEDSLVTEARFRHERLGWELTLRDAVDARDNCLIRQVTVRNVWANERTFKVYFHLDLDIYGSSYGDTAYYDPDLRSLIFYKGKRYFSLSCRSENPSSADPSGFATGKKGVEGLEGTWRDAEDGRLERNPITQGSIDGTIEMTLRAAGGSQAKGWFWIAFGTSIKEIDRLEYGIRREASPDAFLDRTTAYWREWLRKDRHELGLLQPEMASLYKRSLLIIRTHFDNRGAIIAANDADMLKFAKDTYSYMWPRDGALISHALDRSGYADLTALFFRFCRTSLSTDGYMMHKYNPDGSAGSSWHPWIDARGNKQVPIQEDETALVLFALWHHHQMGGTLDRSKEDYERLVQPAADFLVRYRSGSGLPLPSWDLWEERYGVMAFTVSTVYAGLLAAASFARCHGDHTRAGKYQDTADSVKTAVENEMYSPELGRFVRALYWNEQKGMYEPDLKLDASLYGLFDFGLFAPDDPRIERTMRDLYLALSVKTEVGGVARYENDYYHQASQDLANVPGNPWFICTLWYAEWLIAVARTEQDLEQAASFILWANRHSLPSGVMAEQIHPYTGEPLSVSPLAWSHASYVKVVQEYLSKLKSLRDRPKREQDTPDMKLLAAAP
nr:glycoside hydrolase family 15 protein [Cohnella sp. CFH 77786]